MVSFTGLGPGEGFELPLSNYKPVARQLNWFMGVIMDVAILESPLYKIPGSSSAVTVDIPC